jgi:hypothetical protein
VADVLRSVPDDPDRILSKLKLANRLGEGTFDAPLQRCQRWLDHAHKALEAAVAAAYG